MTRVAALFWFCMASMALAEGRWMPLTKDEIHSALIDRKLSCTGAWRELSASGRSLYNAGHDSWGYWRVQGDTYCSTWRPSDPRACYAMNRSGARPRFIGATGDVTEVTYADD